MGKQPRTADDSLETLTFDVIVDVVVSVDGDGDGDVAVIERRGTS